MRWREDGHHRARSFATRKDASLFERGLQHSGPGWTMNSQDSERVVIAMIDNLDANGLRTAAQRIADRQAAL